MRLNGLRSMARRFDMGRMAGGGALCNLMKNETRSICGTNSMSIEIRHLRAFKALMRHGSTVAAARALSLSQPTVSRLLAELETSRRETLFDRANGRLAPRAAAEMLLPEVEALLAGVDALEGQGSAGQPFVVAGPNGIVRRIFAPAVDRLLSERRDLRVAAEIMSYHETLNAVAMGRADVGLVKAPVEHPAVCAVELVRVGTDVIAPAGHPLAGAARLDPFDVARFPLILLGRNRPFRVQLDQAFEQARLRPRIVVETQAVAAACELVARGVGVTIANALLARAEAGPDLVTRPFDVPVEHAFCLIHPARTSKAGLIEAFEGHVRDVVASILVSPANLPPPP